MVRTLLVALALLLSTQGRAATTADFETMVTQGWAATGSPGASTAMVDGATITTDVRGVVRKGNGDLVDEETRFPIGSITKSFTALAILQLEEAGTLSLEDRIGDHLAAFGRLDAGAITIRQLLGHRSGYSTVQGNLGHGDDGAGVNDVERIARVTPAHAAGERWEYSNANYFLLGAIVEATSGEDYEDYLRARVLQPLGIDLDASRPLAVPHRPWFGSKRAFDAAPDDTLSPAGGLVLSARELASYLAMLMNGQDDLISANNKARMMEPADEAAPYYGLGWYLDAEQGTVWHSGLVPGAEAYAAMKPSARKAAVILTNANSGIGIAYNYPLTSKVTAAALDLPPPADEPEWGMKATYFSITLLPLAFLAAIGWALAHRPALAAKRESKAGRMSLWFPLVSTCAVGLVLVLLVPKLFGGSLATLRLFQPDFAMAMIAAAILGPVWALVRLAVAYRA